MTRLFKILLTLDQALGPWIFKGIYPDESISAYVYRTHKTLWIAFINFIFRDENHCFNAFLSEVNGSQNAPDYRTLRERFDEESA